MCVVSMVMDSKTDDWIQRYYPPHTTQPFPYYPFPTPVEIKEFKELLERAREYDKKNHEPDCELQEKKDKLMKIAKELGISDLVNFL